MRQFDVFAFNDPTGAVAVVILQGDYYLDLPTILVAPLHTADSELAYDVINPAVSLGGQKLVVKLDHIASLSRQYLARNLGSLADQSSDIINALDRLIAGY